MISNHKIQTALDEIKDISRIDLALYTEKGKPVAATFEPEGDLEGAITSFADSMAESQMLSGYHFFKVIADGEIEYITGRGCLYGGALSGLPDQKPCGCLHGAVRPQQFHAEYSAWKYVGRRYVQ